VTVVRQGHDARQLQLEVRLADFSRRRLELRQPLFRLGAGCGRIGPVSSQELRSELRNISLAAFGGGDDRSLGRRLRVGESC
jgi:hypothetical protein